MLLEAVFGVLSLAPPSYENLGIYGVFMGVMKLSPFTLSFCIMDIGVKVIVDGE